MSGLAQLFRQQISERTVEAPDGDVDDYFDCFQVGDLQIRGDSGEVVGGVDFLPGEMLFVGTAEVAVRAGGLIYRPPEF